MVDLGKKPSSKIRFGEDMVSLVVRGWAAVMDSAAWKQGVEKQRKTRDVMNMNLGGIAMGLWTLSLSPLLLLLFIKEEEMVPKRGSLLQIFFTTMLDFGNG